MTLKEFKESVFSFIEEHDASEKDLTKDVDIADKINSVVNTKMFEMMRYKKITGKETIEVQENQEMEITDIDKRCYQIRKITGVDYEQEDKFLTFNETGTAVIYYNKYPKTITSDTTNDYKFEIDEEALEIMKIGVAADILKTDVSNRFGQIWDAEYQRLLQTLDSRKTTGTITIGKGVDV